MKVKKERIVANRNICKIEKNTTPSIAAGSKKYLSPQLDKKTYLKEFNARINGPLHEQEWAKIEALTFHTNISKLKQFFCTNCNELWPSTINYCKSCKVDKLLFSKENDMVINDK